MVLYWRRVMERIRSPTRIKSPLRFRYRAMMLLKWLHSRRSSFSAVHSYRRTYHHKIQFQHTRRTGTEWRRRCMWRTALLMAARILELKSTSE